MSAITENTRSRSLGRVSRFHHWLVEIRDWLHHARAALTLPHQDLNNLPDRDLRDISARQTDIGRLIDRDKNWLLQASLTRAHRRVID